MSSPILASISLVRIKRRRLMPPALDLSLDTFTSISWRAANADCASKGILASWMGVGAGFGLIAEAEACWPGVVPSLEMKVRIMSKVIRIIGCVTV